VVVAPPAAGALLGLAGGFLLLGSLPGRDAAGTALVLLVATAVGLAAGVLLSLVAGLWRARRRRPKPEPAATPAPVPRRQRARRPDPESAPPRPEPPAPQPEPELPPPADRTPGWHPDPEGGAERRYWDGGAWTAHRWRPRQR